LAICGYPFEYQERSFFSLGEVLQNGKADCLGYSKLFSLLGNLSGLESGVIEIVIDNRGDMVPHTSALVRLSSGAKQLVDFWYGSSHIRHQRLGLRVKRKGDWQVEDINYRELKKVQDYSYLPDELVEGITLYIEGNRLLKERDFLSAINQYTRAISYYPQNARLFYNRAIAYEQLGLSPKAEMDYSTALKDERSIKRNPAIQGPEVVKLIRLDELGISEKDQAVYLWRNGFITGRQLDPERIATRLNIQLLTVVNTLKEIEEKIDQRHATGDDYPTAI
jgi:tetratricopeptide (TPR) repeat protein